MSLVHGVELRLNRDRIALHEDRGKGVFEPETVAAFVEAVKNDPEGCVIDVGAYTGLFTLLAVKAGAKEVIALEPNMSGYERLVTNLEANSAPSVVQHIRAAASAQDGVGTMEVTGEHVAICSTGKLNLTPPQGAPIVPVMRIDSLERSRPVSVIKMDVEGHELEALRGATATLEAYHPVLFIEVNSRSGGDRGEPITAFLAGFGYEGQPLDDRNMVFR